MLTPFLGRTLLLGVMISGLTVAGAANAATHHRAVRGHVVTAGGQCAPIKSDSVAFDVTGLKSELMVTALSCNEQDKYNAFVAKFHPDLIAEDGALNAYFTRAFGRGAQQAHDDYITQLANVQAESGLQAGSSLCQQRAPMLDEVQVLDTASDLSSYAHGKNIAQPADFETCSAPSASSHTAHIRRLTTHAVVRKHH